VKKYFLTVHPKDRQQLFAIKHYAGRVVYTVGTKDSNPTHHWINKNHDYIPEGLLKILLSSELQFIQLMSGMGPGNTQQLAAAMTTAAATATGGGPKGTVASHSTSKKNLLSDKKVTVADRFVSSMNDLFVSLRSSSCSFIKCLKPNRELKPFTFDDNHVIEQVRSLGLVQVCEVMKVGLPIRIPFQEILSRYQDLYRELFPATTPGSTEEVIFISGLLYALKIPIESYKLGKSMLFFIPNSFELVDLVMSPTVVDSTSREEEIRSGILEGMRIRKLSGELIESLNQRLVRLDDRIGELKLEIDGFDGTIGTVTSDLEGLHDQVQLTKVQMEPMAADLLPREQALLQEIQRDMAMVMNTMKEREEELSSEELKSDSCHLQKIFQTMTQRNEMNESLWNAIANQFHFVNQSSFSEQSEEMRARSSKLLAISSEIDEMMPHVRYLIDKTLKRAERTPILKVQSWCEDCEHNISLLTSQLDRMAELLKEGQEMVRELMKSIEKIQEVVSEIKKMSQEMQRGDEEIKKMSQEIKVQMAELKEKITRYERELEEKLRAKKEAEEIENVRLELERQRLLEEKKRQEKEEEKKKKNQAEVEAAEQERQQFAAASVSVAEETPEEEDDGYNFDEEDEEDDLPLGWEKVVVSSHSGEVMYRSLLTDECQSEYPSGPARTKQVDEEIEEDDKEQESEESLSQEEEKGSLDMGGDAIASTQRGRRRVSFISVTTSDGIVGYEPTPPPVPPAPLVPAVAQEKDEKKKEVDREREKEKDEKEIFQVSVTKRSLVKKLFSIVHEEKYKTEYGGLETVVSVHKKGILFKQGKFFGIWKRMFVVLDGNLLTQYKNSQGYYTDSTPYKVMELTGSSVLSYTKFSNCFTIFSKTNSWVLMTENETEFLEWMNALKTVITALFHERIENVHRSSSNELMKEKKGKKRGDGSSTKTDTAEGWN
jgi:myosin heavy subunit